MRSAAAPDRSVPERSQRTRAAILTPDGIIRRRPIDGRSAHLLAGVSATGIAGHMPFIRAFEHATASVLQPLGYLALATATVIGLLLFGERLHPLTAAGALVIVGSALYAASRERVRVSERSGRTP
jgi:drug/metabolite transporter (DMT)-like permease